MPTTYTLRRELPGLKNVWFEKILVQKTVQKNFGSSPSPCSALDCGHLDTPPCQAHAATREQNFRTPRPRGLGILQPLPLRYALLTCASTNSSPPVAILQRLQRYVFVFYLLTILSATPATSPPPQPILCDSSHHYRHPLSDGNAH